MNYDKEILSETLRELEFERKQRERERNERCALIYAELPRVRSIEDTLRSTAARVVRASLEAGSDPTAAINQLREQNLALQQERETLLVRHGFAPDFLALHPSCPLCADLGYVGTVPCDCLKARYAKKLTARLSTVLPIADQNFSTFNMDYYPLQPDARMRLSPRENMEYNFAFCQDYARQFGGLPRNLLLYGSPGLGKTFLSTCIAKAVSERGFSVAYDTAISILSHYESEKFSSANALEASCQIQKYRQAELLIIDDLGAELKTSFTISALYDILNGRLMTKKPMILSTNLTPVELEKRYSAAIASRILGECKQLRFLGEDIRLIKRRREQ